ncbi:MULTISPECIES: sensor histidine kinase [Streptomyces]|uniref:GAF domain-containing protein n=1 Tax=Streptomyces siderophoricus TaxID=2802281 RepID=A0ABS1MV59_9ACTN|nr:GAF domain-containing sensor histidine kinase [Streptomyces sp. 9-7]MBL1091662.1 GAF domain-containing protein [Streptomyces sp. 9-7]
MRSLLDAVMSLGRGLELPQVLRGIVKAAVTLTDAEYGALGVIGDGQLAQFLPVGMSDELIGLIGRTPCGRGILGELIRNPSPLRLTDLTRHPHSYGFPANHPPMRTFLGVPVRVRDEVFGNLYLTEKRGGGSFDADDEAVLTTLSTAAGVAIDNARMYHESRRRERWLEALGEITRSLLSGTDADEVLRLIAQRAQEVAGADSAAVLLPVSPPSPSPSPSSPLSSSSVDQLTVAVACGTGASRILGLPVPVDGSLPGAAVRSGRPVVSADLRADPRAYPLGRDAAGNGAVKASVGEETPVAGEAPESEEVSKGEETSKGEEAPKREETSKGEEVSKGEQVSKGEEPNGRALSREPAEVDGPTVAVPLQVDTGRGALRLSRLAGRPAFDEAEVTLISGFADQAVIALELARRRAESEELTVLHDRDRIARDLHDLAIQRLFATGITLQSATRLIDRPEAAERVGRAVNDLDTTIKIIRSTIFGLRSTGEGKDGRGLRRDLTETVQRAAGPLGFTPALRIDGPVDAAVPDDLTGHLMAVAAEALSNAARHAQARHLDVLLSVTAGTVTLAVTDDGVGVGDAPHTGGLANMRSRAEMHGGRLTVERPEGGGTRIVWRVPLPD